MRPDRGESGMGRRLCPHDRKNVFLGLETEAASEDPKLQQLAHDLAMHIAASPAEAVREE